MAASAGDIVVTARRRAEDLSKVPISVSAFSGETLERKSVLSVLDLTKITPGLNISASASLANPFITIRGQSRGLAGPGTPGVLSYFNEVPLPATGSQIGRASWRERGCQYGKISVVALPFKQK